MYIENNLNLLLNHIAYADYDSFIIAKNCFPIDRFHLQSKSLILNKEHFNFICIKNILIDKNYRGQGFFYNKILTPLVNSGFNIMIDDIINDNFFHSLINKGFSDHFYHKNNEKIRSCIFLNN